MTTEERAKLRATVQEARAAWTTTRFYMRRMEASRDRWDTVDADTYADLVKRETATKKAYNQAIGALCQAS